MVPSLVARIQDRLQSIEGSPYRDALVLSLQDHAIEQAAAIDKILADSQKQLPLAGLTFVVKVLICIEKEVRLKTRTDLCRKSETLSVFYGAR